MKAGMLVAGKYRVFDKLGEGGMGSVWQAKNEVTERDFAIKFLHEGPAKNEAQLSRFFQEARVAGRLRHPSIVEIFDAGTEPTLNHAPYLVMEMLEGIGLDQAILRAGALPLGVSLEIVADVARALSLAHEKGIIHRDLKPSNVYLHRSGSGSLVPKVLDFGISKVLFDESTGKHLSGLTRTGAIVGSPLYMSPEQAAGDKTIDARSDVHSLGVLLWECLVGRPPFDKETYGLLLVEVIQGERPSLGSLLPNTPASVTELVAQAFARERDQRFAHAGEFAERVERELTSLGHKPLLPSRGGAEAFFRLLGKDGAAPAERPTSTTAAVSVPASARPATPATLDDAAPLPKYSALDASVAIPVSRSRPGLLTVLAIVAAVVAAGSVVLIRSNGSSSAPESSTAPTATSPVVAASPPDVTSVVEPEPSATPPPSPSALASAKKPLAPPRVQTRPPGVQAPPPASKPSVDHGVRSSGL